MNIYFFSDQNGTVVNYSLKQSMNTIQNIQFINKNIYNLVEVNKSAKGNFIEYFVANYYFL